MHLPNWIAEGLARIPRHISDALIAWTLAVGKLGLDEVRKIPGYHDEPLMRARKGQRSIRLNKAWRAFYVVVTVRPSSSRS